MKNLIAKTFALATFALCATAFAQDKDKPVTGQEIKTTVNGHMADIKACMAGKGEITGKLTVAFMIEADGHVSKADADHHSNNKDLDACVAKAFKTWSFPKPRGGGQWYARYPITFTVPKPAPQGTLTEDQIQAAAKPKVAVDAPACVIEAQKDVKENDRKDIAGLVELGIALDAAGKVVDVDILSSTTNNAKVDRCIVEHAKLWPFPKPKGGEFSFKYPVKLVAAPADEKKK